jgi:hypothetical protein
MITKKFIQLDELYSKFNTLDEWVLQLFSWKFEGVHPTCLVKQRCQLGGTSDCRHGFVGPCPHRNRDYGIRSNFWKFYLIRTGFTLGEPVSFVKVFRLFRLERIFLGVQSVDTVGRCTTSYLVAGPARLWCLVSFHFVLFYGSKPLNFMLLQCSVL